MTRSALLHLCLAVAATVAALLGCVVAWGSPNGANLAALFAVMAMLSAATALVGSNLFLAPSSSEITELARLQSLIAHFPEGVVLLDATGQVVFANPLACQLLELPLEKLVGQRDVNNGWQPVGLTANPAGQRVLPAIDAFASAQQVVRYRRRDETEIELSYRLMRLQGPDAADPQYAGYAWVFQETASSAKEVERAMNTQALGLALQAKSTFLMSIAHELRNPLAAIAGAVSLIERQLGPKADSRLNNNLHILASATKHLRNVIDTTFNESKRHVGQPALRIDSLALGPLVSDAIGMVEDMAETNGIRLNCDAIDPKLGVRADATRLTQVLINLLTNALKYNRPAGSVFVRFVHLPEHIGVSVEDTGYGIQPQNLARIFHLFERADAAETTIGGAGIGLALAKYYVERMHGTIEVTSAIGVGSRFTVTLPRAIVASGSATRAAPSAITSV